MKTQYKVGKTKTGDSGNVIGQENISLSTISSYSIFYLLTTDPMCSSIYARKEKKSKPTLKSVWLFTFSSLYGNKTVAQRNIT